MILVGVASGANGDTQQDPDTNCGGLTRDLVCAHARVIAVIQCDINGVAAANCDRSWYGYRFEGWSRSGSVIPGGARALVLVTETTCVDVQCTERTWAQTLTCEWPALNEQCDVSEIAFPSFSADLDSGQCLHVKVEIDVAAEAYIPSGGIRAATASAAAGVAERTWICAPSSTIRSCIRLPDTTDVTDRVQFREDEDTLAFVASLGLNPNEVAREAFVKEVRRLRAEAKVKKLRSFGLHLGKAGVAKDIRELRDSR